MDSKLAIVALIPVGAAWTRHRRLVNAAAPPDDLRRSLRILLLVGGVAVVVAGAALGTLVRT